MKNISTVIACIILVLATACSNGSGSKNKSNNKTNSESTGSSSSATIAKTDTFDGTYKLVATPDTNSANDGGDCSARSDGTMIIANSIISGAVTTAEGYTFDLTGAVDSSGIITGGYAYDGDEIVTYTGKISGTSGTGVWDDLYECAGTWSISIK